MIALRLDWSMLLSKKEAEVAPSWHGVFRIVFYIFAIVFLISAYPAFLYFAPGTDYDARIATAIANVGLYGAVSIRMFFYLFYERLLFEKNCRKYGRLFFVWLAFMVLAIISVNESIWPFWFLIMFGSFYLAPLDRNDIEEIVDGLVTGMIIGFFWIQGRAFLYRPYDADHRYYGHYTNQNVNAMFYVFSYIAWLIKLTLLRIHGKKYWYAFSFLMASSMWVFVFFTGSRSGWMGVAGATLFYWLIECSIMEKRRILNLIGRICLMAVLAGITFLPVYACMRYIPPLRHHPIWYQSEYSDDRIMAWDPIDSPKYFELDEILPVLLRRFYTVTGSVTVSDDYSSESVNESMIQADDISPSIELPIPQFCSDGERVESYSDGVVPGTDSDHPIYIENDENHSFFRRALGIRYYIYRYDISRLNVLGNEKFETAYVLEEFNLVHAHNTVLMIAYWFGWPAGLLFMSLLFMVPLRILYDIFIIKNRTKEKDMIFYAELAIVLCTGYALLGLFECVAFPGEIGLTLFFVALLPVIRPLSFENITDN